MTAVLITGTSSGIGRATALRLARRPDLTVYTTARRVEAISDLAAAGARLLPLDVTDEASMRAAVDAVEVEHGAVGVLVNNAGYGLLPRQQVRRRSPHGRVALGSRPVRRPGQPDRAGADSDRFGSTAGETLAGSAGPTGPYAALNTAADQQMAAVHRSKLAAPPETVAAVIERAATARSPRTRYVVTVGAMAVVHTRRLLGARVFDTYLRVAFRPRGQPRST